VFPSAENDLRISTRPCLYIICIGLYISGTLYIIYAALYISGTHFMVCAVLYISGTHFMVCAVLYISGTLYVVCAALYISGTLYIIQGVPGVKVITSGFNSRPDSESKTSYTHGSNSQQFRSYEFLKYSQ
jgi:hypothetical protein